jgi:hypothetical protein
MYLHILFLWYVKSIFYLFERNSDGFKTNGPQIRAQHPRKPLSMRFFVFIMCSSADSVILKNAGILLVGDIGSMYQAPDCQRYMEHVQCCI